MNGGGEGIAAAKRNVPLGKYVSQLEMKDPVARRRLKEMLEFQMKERKVNDKREQMQSRTMVRPPTTMPQPQL